MYIYWFVSSYECSHNKAKNHTHSHTFTHTHTHSHTHASSNESLIQLTKWTQARVASSVAPSLNDSNDSDDVHATLSESLGHRRSCSRSRSRSRSSAPYAKCQRGTEMKAKVKLCDATQQGLSSWPVARRLDEGTMAGIVLGGASSVAKWNTHKMRWQQNIQSIGKIWSGVK